MTPDLSILAVAAVSIGFFHTLLGPDHYLPFIMMARAGNWSLKKTCLVTFLCGLGHVGSSAVLGMIGVALGLAVTRVEAMESFRGNFAAWALIAFGLVYFVWGLRRAGRHKHRHTHSTGTSHRHSHTGEHARTEKKAATPWILFTIFIFGPCEPLIPILIYPAAKENFFGMAMVACVFSVATISTMLCMVCISSMGLGFLPLGRLERFTHALAGFTVCLSGVAIQFLGL